MVTRNELQKRIITLIFLLIKNSLRCTYNWTKYRNSDMLEITFTFRENIETITIIKAQMPEVYDYFHEISFGVKDE